MTTQDIEYIQNEQHVKTPSLATYLKSKSIEQIFRLDVEHLNHFFDKRCLKLPDNEGEERISLKMLKECGYNDGLC